MIHQANFLQALGWAVLNSLWQLALLWVLYQVLSSLFRNAGPAAKSVLASALLIGGFGWFVFTFFIVFGQTPEAGSSIYLAGFGDGAVSGWLDKILPVASVFYLLLLFPPIFRFVRNYRYVQALRQYGLSRIDPTWRLYVQEIAARMGIRKPVHIWISEWVTSPVTIGYLKPVILVPLAAINRLSTQQMEAVLLHELAHIRRMDYLLNLILNLIRTILYFNPFARAFVQIVETEREKHCDEMVLQFQYDSHEYASALLSLEKISREQRLLILGATGSGQALLQRVEVIMGVQSRQRFNLRRFSSVLATLLCVIGLHILLVFTQSLGIKGQSNIRQIVSSTPWETHDNLAKVPMEYAANRVVNHPGSPVVHPDLKNALLKPVTYEAVSRTVSHPDYVQVNYKEVPEVILAPEAETMVKEAVQSSRKVLEGAQWKSIEKNLADAFSTEEKEAMKSALRNEFSKFDWDQWENKLRLAYNNVDWEKVNSQLNQAVNMIRTDSLVKVYNEALVNINQAQKQMQELSIKGIPDTDISLKDLINKKQQLLREMNRLKSVRNKKIVQL